MSQPTPHEVRSSAAKMLRAWADSLEHGTERLEVNICHDHKPTPGAGQVNMVLMGSCIVIRHPMARFTLVNADGVRCGGMAYGTTDEVIAVRDRTEELALLGEEHLASNGWQPSSEGALRYWSKLLPPHEGKAAITELRVSRGEQDEGWEVNIVQGYPDEPNAPDDCVLVTSKAIRTVGHLAAIMRALS